MKIRPLVAAMLAAAATPALAEGPSYKYLEIDFLSTDIGVSGDGLSLRGSFPVSEPIYLFASYSTTGFANAVFGLDVDATELRLGAGWRREIVAGTDFIAELNLERTDVEVQTLGSAADNGYGLGLGVRSMLTSAVELNGKLRRVDYGNGANDTLLGAGVVWSVKDTMAVTFGYETGDTDTLNLGLRFGF